MPETTISTTLTESVNIVLANIGESPVNSITGAIPVQVSLALNTIEEVSADVQSKGWWFNQNSSYDVNGVATGTYAVTNDITIRPSDVSNDWHDGIPEEARRYITIRASRIAQTRLVGSEELQKFSYNEELVSLAILQQAHVRNSNGVLNFNEFPTELKGLGVDEVMFLQGNVEEKIGTLRLGGELANIAKTKAEAALVAEQERLVEKQVTTEEKAAEKVQAEKALIDAQELKTDAEKLLVDEQAGLITNQAATELKKALDLVADTTIKGKQGALIDKQVLTEVKNTLKVAAETSLIADQEALVAQQTLTETQETSKRASEKTLIDAQKLKTDEEKTLTTKQGTFVDKQALTEVENALKVAAETSLLADQEQLVVNQAATELKRALDVAADTTIKGKQGLLIDKQALTEVENALKIAAETSLLADQEALVVNQAATELKKALDIAADTTLKTKQGALVDAQELKTDAETLQVGAQTALLTAQELTVDAERDKLEKDTAINLTAEKAFYDGVVAGTQNTYRDFAPEMRMMGIQESSFQSLPAYKKVELISDAQKLRTSTATDTSTDATEITEVNKVMRLIGEAPISGLNSNSLASECVRLLRDTDKELQGRGWYFNTEEDVELTPSNGIITIATDILSVEANEYNIRIKRFGTGYRLYDLDEKSDTSWASTVKAKVIYKRDLNDVPAKYLEYLSVRTAILLTELYPQSGIDIQRLPKMEQELRAYFKDREFDGANYSLFDNYDAAARIGINRNYSLI